MIERLRRHPVRTAILAAVVVGGLAWLAFGFFAVHTLFVDERVSEAVPVFDATTTPEVPLPTAPTTAPTTTPTTTTPTTTTPTTTPATTPVTTPDTATPAVPSASPVVERQGTFESGAHATSGRAVVLGNGTGQRFVRLEDFETENGPDLNVYLVSSATGDASDAVDLGDLKGNIGDQNYELPAGVDLDRYDRVVIWCVRFGVAFGNADLT